jgi:very-short-patch-repair endonuclease
MPRRVWESIRKAEERCRRLAEGQAGVISNGQAMELGLPDHVIKQRVQSGELVRVFRGIYRYAGLPMTRQTFLWACLLWAGKGARFSHTTAGSLWKLKGIASEVVEITLPKPKRSPHQDIVLHSSRRISKRDLTKIGRIPVTTVPRTLLDIGTQVTEEAVEIALDDALFRKLTTLRRVRDRIEEAGGQGCPGSHVLKSLMAFRSDEDNPCESPLETKLLRYVRHYRLPKPVVQFRVLVNGSLVARPDLAYPDRRLAIEAQSAAWHGNRARWEADLQRGNTLASLGWQVIHAFANRIRIGDPTLANEIKAAYRERERLIPQERFAESELWTP